MIAVPVLTLVPGELGGSETYVRELLRALRRVGEHEYRVVLPPAAPDAAEGLPAVVAPEYRMARSIPQRLAAMSLASVRPGPLRHHLDDAQAVHFPLTVAIPRTSLPSIVTLHDLQHLDLPGMFSRAERLFRAAFWHPALRRADRVIVMSEFVRERAVSRLGLDPGRITVIPMGVDQETLSPGNGAREPFLLYPARRWKHKNHERLFEAFSLVRKERPSLKLVLTGGGDFAKLPDAVESRGYVARGELIDLMRHASAVVFPSLYEGFGLPPLEAMACGCPVACSNAGALPEAVGDAALLFDPRDPEAIAAAIREVLDEPERWSTRGLEHARAYSWDATARATDAVYSELSTRA